LKIGSEKIGEKIFGNFDFKEFLPFLIFFDVAIFNKKIFYNIYIKERMKKIKIMIHQITFELKENGKSVPY